MVRLHDFIDVAVPCDQAYRQWLAFEDYPQFMAGVREVRHNGTRLHWCAEADGGLEEWDAEIVEEVAPSRLAWQGSDGREGIVVVHPLAFGLTRVFVEMDQAPLEHAVDARHYIEAASRRMHSDLENFKERIELRAAESETRA